MSAPWTPEQVERARELAPAMAELLERASAAFGKWETGDSGWVAEARALLARVKGEG